jgi:DNA-binding transcriptional LysR family regulator
MVDWDDLRFFLAIAEHGSLTAASEVLGVTHPTAGRRLAAFEKRLGAKLFVRTPSGFTLTGLGRRVLAEAVQMRERALFAYSLATGKDSGVNGAVRITASEWLIRSVVVPALAPLLAEHPALSVEFLAEARHLNLVKRDADIALRPSRFTHQEVFQREVAVLGFGLYASDGYLSRRGMPDFARGAEGHALVDMTEELRTVVDRDWLPRVAPNARVVARCNGRDPMVTMAVAGLGVACLPRFLGDATPGLRRVSTALEEPSRPLYMGVHGAARTTPRVRATLTCLQAAFERLRGAFCPD